MSSVCSVFGILLSLSKECICISVSLPSVRSPVCLFLWYEALQRTDFDLNFEAQLWDLQRPLFLGGSFLLGAKGLQILTAVLPGNAWCWDGLAVNPAEE